MPTALKRRTAVLVLALLAALIALLAQYFGLLTTWQERVYDRFFTAHEASQNIVIAAIDSETLTTLGGWPLPRETFATTLRHLSGAKAVGFDISFVDPSSFGALDDAQFVNELQKTSVRVVLGTHYDDRGGKLVEPLASYAQAAGEGYANVIIDGDGVVRTFLPVQKGTESLSRALIEGDEAFPETVRINWTGPAGSILTIPLIDVYRGVVPQTVLADKLVLVGATAKDLHDTLTTPVGTMSGVEVHANALATLTSGVFLRDASAALVALLILLSALIPAVTILLLQRIVPLILLLIAECALLNFLSVWLFGSHVRLPNLSLTLAFLLSAGAVLVYQYLSESQEKKRIREMFQYYLMPEVIEELAAHPERLALGGEEKKLTILFCDIRGFTTLSEGLSPSELTTLINEYLTAMTDAIMASGGLVDKYIGDAVMAFWGAPVAHEEQEKAACRGALAMLQALDRLNSDLASRGKKPIHIGIGLSTGQVVVGNMGSSKRFNYTVMGDEVNFASRLEGLTKAYGVSCIIGEETASALEHDATFTVRTLDQVMVKGKREPRTIYELILGEATPTQKEQLTHFQEGRGAYVKGEWQKAEEHFQKALVLGEDGPSRTLLERTQALQSQKPSNWKGIWEFTTK
jgi:adenylate cyclase